MSDDVDESSRERLLAKIYKLLAKWQPILGVSIRDVQLRKMKTYWASVNEAAGRMLVNPRLIEEPPSHIELVIVHELVHMKTDGHDEKFYALMDRHLPGWRRIHTTFAGPMTRHS